MDEEITRQIMKLRFRGALIGALVGDCYGAPFESGRRRKKADPSILFDTLEELSRREKKLQYTDDTAMSISTCKSLLSNKAFDARHLAKEFSESYFKEPERGYGPSVRTTFKLLRDTNYQDPFGPASNQFDGSGSLGNGAAMRSIGVGLFAYREKMNDGATIDLSENCARITHTHPHGMNGATILVMAVRYLLQLKENEFDEIQFVDYLIDKMRELERGYDKEYSAKLGKIKSVLLNLSVSGNDVNQAEIVQLLGNGVAAPHSVPLAIYSFIRGNSKFTDSYRIENEFYRTLHWAISCGGDTDTIATMACGLSGAYLGIDKIPEHLYKNCESWEDIIGHADQFLPGSDSLESEDEYPSDQTQKKHCH